ncbi:MAG TPA: UDP-N-acetylglucosamine--N-acetylmuramyl-(pentapeptide) pyrophosphoryl-undecaprenol N-acetylglucosamine transferase [Chloroflexota bacterium]|nr:UDP-N-acetylglucosamine--N-acetylmuramyl-(pentapeptide) pyrophosphoryl-undecaprenol N-acetylglucosamine transferase [Chloroflexota bacterium]
MRVLLAGGGSGGSAAPVIAVAEALKRTCPDAEFLYLITSRGPEGEMVRAAGIPTRRVHSGRLRRYATWRNATDPFLVLAGLAEAATLARDFRPAVAFGAGGFATVPPLIAAAMARTPIAIHQQDVQPGLANRILRPFASAATIALQDTRRWSRWRNAPVVGNPVRDAMLHGSAERARATFDLEQRRPVVLITGGGTGALRLNQLAAGAAHAILDHAQVLHLTGVGKGIPVSSNRGYRQIEFLTTEMADALAVADVIVSRAGMSALSEIAALEKPAIVLPMPGSHQVLNADALRRHDAAVVLDERACTGAELAEQVIRLLGDRDRRARLGRSLARMLPTDAADAIARGLTAIARGRGQDRRPH